MSKHQYEYRKAMDSIHVTKEWEDHMIQNLMNAGEKNERRSRRAPKMGIAVAAAAACLTIGAGAAEVATGAVSDFFAPLLGTAHTEIIDSIGYPIGVSDSDAGVTVTADAIIGDTNSICVVFSLEKEDGSAWDPDLDVKALHFEDSTFDFDVEKDNPDGWGAHGSSWFFDETPGDSVIQFVEQRTVDGGKPCGRGSETMKNLCYWDEDTDESRPLFKGKWKLRFEVGFEDTVQHFTAGQAIEFYGAPATVREISLSPISFRVEVEQSGNDYSPSGDPRYLDGEIEALDTLSVVLKLKDGRELDLGYSSGGSVDGAKEETAVFTKSDMLSEIIPLEEMESIVICGTEIPLN